MVNKIIFALALAFGLSASAGQQVITNGTGPDEGLAEDGWSAFQKVNANFTELYGGFNALTSSITPVGSAVMASKNFSQSSATNSIWGNFMLNPIGDSITYGYGTSSNTWVQLLAAQLGKRPFNNQGISSQTSVQITARENAIDAPLTVSGGTIPASGGVTVTFDTGYEVLNTNYSGPPLVGSIAGVYGSLSLSNTTFTFTRSTNGSSVSLSGKTNWVTSITNQLNGFVTLWMGFNNLYEPNTIISNYAAMVSKMAPNTNYLVLSIWSDTNYGIGTAYYTNALTVNTALSNTYGMHFFDARGFLISQASTATDTNYIANGLMPPSMLLDRIHPNGEAQWRLSKQLASYINSNFVERYGVLVSRDGTSGASRSISLDNLGVGCPPPSAGGIQTSNNLVIITDSSNLQSLVFESFRVGSGGEGIKLGIGLTSDGLGLVLGSGVGSAFNIVTPKADNVTMLGRGYPFTSFSPYRWSSASAIGLGCDYLFVANSNAPASSATAGTNGAIVPASDGLYVYTSNRWSKISFNPMFTPVFAQLSKLGGVTNSYNPGTDITNFTMLTTTGGFNGSTNSGILTNLVAGYYRVSASATLNANQECRLGFYTNNVFCFGWDNYTSLTGNYGRSVGGIFNVYLPTNTASSIRAAVGTQQVDGFLSLEYVYQ